MKWWPDALARARAIAAAALPVGLCEGPASPQTFHQDAPQPSCPECGPDLDVFYRTFDPPTVLAMLDVIELLSEAKLHVPHGTALRVDIDNALDRVRTLIGDGDA